MTENDENSPDDDGKRREQSRQRRTATGTVRDTTNSDWSSPRNNKKRQEQPGQRRTATGTVRNTTNSDWSSLRNDKQLDLGDVVPGHVGIGAWMALENCSEATAAFVVVAATETIVLRAMCQNLRRET